ncbi:hypothetical protein ST37_14160 [Vibrio sp. qd031]|uniref:DUF4382 domain-containing protein n=1 Tax=Vibrio sp. qd031 TaxID=1603038 RepID=UPI000A119D38|nr:DUF4382 domain-containing protein [Vibrio sp. qd031]ORT49533.1 hypothetical protein ST37_14160 [Vibrio sp. qd031]
MLTKHPITLLTLPLILTACGGESSTQETKTAKVSFAITDAPVLSATEVVVAYDAIEIKHQNGERYYFELADANNSGNYLSVNLLDYQGDDALPILSNEPIAVGTYKEVILHTLSQHSYVVDNGQHYLKIPSNKLKLGGFEVTQEAVQSFTIDFNLQKSLVLRGNSSSNNGYNLKPHGVSIVDNSAVATLTGNVESDLWSAGDCALEDGKVVYLYKGHNHILTDLVDNLDPTDSEYVTNPSLPSQYVAPFSSVYIDEIGNYTFGFVPAGDYSVAFSCSANDDPIQYDEIAIPNPEGQLKEVTLVAGETLTADFITP